MGLPCCASQNVYAYGIVNLAKASANSVARAPDICWRPVETGTASCSRPSFLISDAIVGVSEATNVARETLSGGAVTVRSAEHATTASISVTANPSTKRALFLQVRAELCEFGGFLHR